MVLVVMVAAENKDKKNMKKNIIDSIHPLVMTEEFWANSEFSIARYYGRIKINSNEYIIVNKEGKDISNLFPYIVGSAGMSFLNE